MASWKKPISYFHTNTMNSEIACHVCNGYGFLIKYKDTINEIKETCPRCNGKKMLPMVEYYRDEARANGFTGKDVDEYARFFFRDWVDHKEDSK